MISESPQAGASSDGSTGDEALLDQVFEQMLWEIEDGRVPVVSELMPCGLSHLEPEIRRLQRLALEAATARPRGLPRVSSYEILEEIGRGGMGVVYLARQSDLGGRLVALKMLLPGMFSSASARQRFRTEALVLARIRHQSVVQVHDVVEDEASLAYVMEVVDGKSLSDLLAVLKQGGQLPSVEDLVSAIGGSRDNFRWPTYTAWVCDVGICLARALSVVHREGILHRDIKPSNVLIRSDGTAVLCDFGLAREEAGPTLTQAGQFLGTLAYSPPEQLRGDRASSSERSDIYSLGATLYEALTFEPCQQGKSPSQVLVSLQRSPVALRLRRDRQLPVDLRTVLGKSLEVSPNSRYSSANGLADDLQRVTELRPVRARPPSAAWRLALAVKRNRVALAGVTAGAFAALAIAWSLWYTLFHVPAQVEHALRRGRLALLNPEQGERFASAAWKLGRAPAEGVEARLDTALAEYSAASRGYDCESELEHSVLLLAKVLFNADAEPAREPYLSAPVAEILREQAPSLCHVYIEHRSTPPSQALESLSLSEATPADLLGLGLLAYLRDDLEVAQEAWTELEHHRRLGPHVAAALAEVSLALGRPQRATRLLDGALSGFSGLSGAEFLKVDAADAALRSGELALAGRLIRELGSVGKNSRLDSQGTLDRVRIDYLAREGDPVEASNAYCELYRGRLLPTARYHHALLLRDLGSYREALHQMMVLIQHRPDVPEFQATLRRTAREWWATLREGERMQAIVESVWFRDPFLRLTLVHFTAIPAATERDFPRRDFLPQQGETESFEESATPVRVFVAPSLVTCKLEELAHRMEVLDTHRWGCVLRFSFVAKSLQIMAWDRQRNSTWIEETLLAPREAILSSSLLHNLLQHTTSARLSAFAIFFALTVGPVQAQPTPVYPSFENTPYQQGRPSGLAFWWGDEATVVGPSNGVTPLDGNHMLQFLGTNWTGPSAGTTSEVFQLLDLSSFQAPLTVRVSVVFNRVHVDSETDSAFNVMAQHRMGTASNFSAEFRAGTPGPVDHSVCSILTDADPLTWEVAAVNLHISGPIESDSYLVIRVAAAENVFNDLAAPEFDGHFADMLQIELLPDFLRGDVNDDSTIDISDPVTLLGYLFQGSNVACVQAMDANDDEGVDVADVIYLLQYLFGQGPPTPPPGACGPDPTNGCLPCEVSSCP